MAGEREWREQEQEARKTKETIMALHGREESVEARIVEQVEKQEQREKTLDRASTGIGWAQAAGAFGITSLNFSPDQLSWWIGVIISVLMGVQGQITNKR